jgi:hypothetical protein
MLSLKINQREVKKMYKVFVEYAINSTERETYLTYMQEWMKREARLELYEGTDQPGLFVEIWHDVSYEEYAQLKQQRKENGMANLASFREEWLKGGFAKLHIWLFSIVR